MIRLDDMDANGRSVTPERLAALKADPKGAPMLSRVGAETKDKSLIFFKGTGKGTKDKYGNEIQSDLLEMRLARQKDRQPVALTEEARYTSPNVEKKDIQQIMHENQLRREQEALERQKRELVNGYANSDDESKGDKKKTAPFFEEAMTKLGERRRDKTPQQKAEEARK